MTDTLWVLNRSNTGPFDQYLTGIFRASSVPFHSWSLTIPVVSDRYRSVRRTGPFRSVPFRSVPVRTGRYRSIVPKNQNRRRLVSKRYDRSFIIKRTVFERFQCQSVTAQLPS